MKAPSTLLPDLAKLDILLRTKTVGKKTVVESGTLIVKNVRAHETVCDNIEIYLEPHQRMALIGHKDLEILKYAVRTESGYFRVCVEIENPKL